MRDPVNDKKKLSNTEKHRVLRTEFPFSVLRPEASTIVKAHRISAAAKSKSTTRSL